MQKTSTELKRALKFLLVFVLVAGAIYAMVIGFNYSAFKTLFENQEGMAEGSEYVANTYSLKDLTRFIANKPEYVSIVSYNVNDPDSGIYYQADTPRAMGTLGNIILLIEYERQVAEGYVSRDETVDLAEIEKYALPQISENAHEAAMDHLDDVEGSPTLDDAMAAMLEYNDLSISDYFWFKFGTDSLLALMDTLGMPNTDLPVPFSGHYTALNRTLVNQTRDGDFHLKKMMMYSRGVLNTSFIYTASDYANNDSLNQLRREVFEDERLKLNFMQERDALLFFPRTTARDMANLLAQLHKNEIISEEVSTGVKNHLRWPLDSVPIQRSFSDYGAIYDTRMGLLSGIDFGTSLFDGHTSVQAIIFDELPVAFWHHMSANHMQEDFQQRLIWDPALYETTQKAISEKDTTSTL